MHVYQAATKTFFDKVEIDDINLGEKKFVEDIRKAYKIHKITLISFGTITETKVKLLCKQKMTFAMKTCKFRII